MSDTDKAKELLRAAARQIGSPVWQRIRPRIETIAARYALQAEREAIAHSDRTTQAIREEINALRREVNDLRHIADELRPRTDTATHEVRAMGTQVAAVDERLAILERTAEISTTTDADNGEARALVDEIRDEHAKVRARLTAMASYEERIGRLETDRDRT
ncbi:hypothetical protein SAMN05192558_108124 [Actinokineospora alba]|uniref:Uncharacterized protein n=1 Tax=Actinokineospora alba TaxID=504798 RepID=A0A1H0RTM6_9PSEU|nr:hypothetical protein [Actinokineospora alba]TDP66918.1 hypothetical protein C8E96_2436 [Actinokineospora alba]SDJ34050.1 hypothetical protein SAMN05421871_113124 [Actinokineospora alba]SDP32892.1 hypothetical protein SAMN05192558_108124 [Actinokineospora alba]